MKPLRTLLPIVLLLLLTGCLSQKTVRIFYAPCFSPVFETNKVLLQQQLGQKYQFEVSGSQMICRKITELDRECDVICLADARLFKELLPEHTSWRIEFAHDEVVLGIGIRAPMVDQAEKDWITVLQNSQVVLGRVDESLGPIGYRTLLVWEILEQQGYPGLRQRLTDKTGKVLDHVDHLAALLKNGDVDYGFLYKTTCRQNDIRYISLSPELNQGSDEYPYADYSVAFEKIRHGKKQTVTIPGSIITYGISIPNNAPHPKQAILFIRALLSHPAMFEEKGYRIYQPQFFGSREAYQTFSDLASYGGDF